MSEIDKSMPESAVAPAAAPPAGEQKEAAARNGAGEAEDAGALRAAQELEQARADRDRAVQERDALIDRLKRTQAEFENIRRRLYKEKEEVVQYAASDTVESLLPIIDDFEGRSKRKASTRKSKRGWS